MKESHCQPSQRHFFDNYFSPWRHYRDDVESKKQRFANVLYMKLRLPKLMGRTSPELGSDTVTC